MKKQVSQTLKVRTQMIIDKHSIEVDIFNKVGYDTENDSKRMKQRHDSMKLIDMKVHIDANLYPKAIC